jgi:hypothetical protein
LRKGSPFFATVLVEKMVKQTARISSSVNILRFMGELLLIIKLSEVEGRLTNFVSSSALLKAGPVKNGETLRLL